MHSTALFFFRRWILCLWPMPKCACVIRVTHMCEFEFDKVNARTPYSCVSNMLMLPTKNEKQDTTKLMPFCVCVCCGDVLLFLLFSYKVSFFLFNFISFSRFPLMFTFFHNSFFFLLFARFSLSFRNFVVHSSLRPFTVLNRLCACILMRFFRYLPLLMLCVSNKPPQFYERKFLIITFTILSIAECDMHNIVMC